MACSESLVYPKYRTDVNPERELWGGEERWVARVQHETGSRNIRRVAKLSADSEQDLWRQIRRAISTDEQLQRDVGSPSDDGQMNLAFA